MKKRKGFVGYLAGLTAVLCLITMCLTSGTLAKYTSSVDGDATATVAKWNVTFTDGGSTTYNDTTAITLNLKDTEKETANLVAADKIAPGTTGSFKLAVNGNDTEVAFDYSIQMNMGAAGLDNAPIKFYSDEQCTTPLSETSTDSKIYELKGSVMTNASSKEAEQTVYWKWVTTDDPTDTNLGTTSAANPLTYTIPVSITATQKLTTT